jgi:hypothetical protein
VSVAEIESAMVRVCFDRAPDAKDVDLLGGSSILLYRDLVRSRLRELLSVALPKTERAIGAERTTQLFDAFLAEAPPRSRYFREVVPDFLAHVMPRLGEAIYPAHAADVARLEGTQWELGWRAGDIEGDVGELDLERAPVPHPTLRLLAFSHAVEKGEIAPDKKGTFHACVHRRGDHLVETRPLDPTSARLVAAWLVPGRSAIEGVRAVLAEEKREADPAFVEKMSSLLAALRESGAILGSR